MSAMLSEQLINVENISFSHYILNSKRLSTSQYFKTRSCGVVWIP